jgi:cystathionine gamma-synthase
MLLNPKRIAITGGYMGVQQGVQQLKRIRNGNLEVIDIDDAFQDGDLCWIETPMNPTGESRNIQYYADKVLVPLRSIGNSAYPSCPRPRFTPLVGS